MTKKQVWLNINTGEFSNSWIEAEVASTITTEELIEQANEAAGWKLIEYECLNDEDFDFYNMMRIK